MGILQMGLAKARGTAQSNGTGTTLLKTMIQL